MATNTALSQDQALSDLGSTYREPLLREKNTVSSCTASEIINGTATLIVHFMTERE
jgi:hypothetical protein